MKAQVQFVHKNVWYNFIKGRAKVNEEYPYIALPGVPDDAELYYTILPIHNS